MRGRKPTHGESKRVARGNKPLSEWRIWVGMWNRCTNPNDAVHYSRYAARGIVVCERWRRYEAFLADMGRRPSSLHSLERVDNDGPYSPDNCRWATRKEQARNRRNTVYLTVDGETRSRAEWAELKGLSVRIIDRRMNRDGWSAERAVMTTRAA